MGDNAVDLDGRRLRTRRSREALSRAAFDLLTERGLDAMGVEDIAVRAGVARRTFSRHFASIEAAVLGDIDQDVHQFNAALRRRPADEPPLLAYRRSVHDWLVAEYSGDRSDQLGRRWLLFQRFEQEPALFAGYQRIRIEGQQESVAILADRMGVDPTVDLRPVTVVAVGTGVLMAALQTWAAGSDPGTLPELIEGCFGALDGLTSAEDYRRMHSENRIEESPS